VGDAWNSVAYEAKSCLKFFVHFALLQLRDVQKWYKIITNYYIEHCCKLLNYESYCKKIITNSTVHRRIIYMPAIEMFWTQLYYNKKK